MKAIAYVRFSSDDQADGTSVERQTANVKGYCQRVGLELVETLIDDGYSAFKGVHLSKGKLGQFLLDADNGKYRGYALVVEQMDRLSRLEMHDTLDLTRRIVNAGIDIHITQQNRVISASTKNDLGGFLLQAVESYNSNEYSRKLRERVSAAWGSKQAKAVNGISLTGKLPGWLRGKVGESIVADPDCAKVVREIFEMTASGMGHRLVAKTLNDRNTPTFGAGRYKVEKWRYNYIHRILTNRAVLGEYRPRRGAKETGEVLPDFYPAIVDPVLWQKAQDAMTSRRQSGTTGGLGKFAGRTGSIASLFSGLVWNITDEGAPLPMYYKARSKTKAARIETERNDGKRAQGVEYAKFESAFLRFLDELDWVEILDVAESTELLQAEEEAGRLSLEIERTELQIEKLTNLLLDTPSSTLKQRLLDAEKKLEGDKAAKTAAEAKLDDLRKKNRDLLDESVAYSRLLEDRSIETRAKLRDEIRRKVDRIELDFGQERFSDPRAITTRWVASIRFVNGVKRIVTCTEGRLYILSKAKTNPAQS